MHHMMERAAVGPIVILLAAAFLAFLGFLTYFMIRILQRRNTGPEPPPPEPEPPDQERYASLAEALKAQRTAHNLTQEQVAEALNISRQAVSKWENGTAEPSTSNLLALAKLYNVDLNELLRGISL